MRPVRSPSSGTRQTLHSDNHPTRVEERRSNSYLEEEVVCGSFLLLALRPWKPFVKWPGAAPCRPACVAPPTPWGSIHGALLCAWSPPRSLESEGQSAAHAPSMGRRGPISSRNSWQALRVFTKPIIFGWFVYSQYIYSLHFSVFWYMMPISSRKTSNSHMETTTFSEHTLW